MSLSQRLFGDSSQLRTGINSNEGRALLSSSHTGYGALLPVDEADDDVDEDQPLIRHEVTNNIVTLAVSMQIVSMFKILLDLVNTAIDAESPLQVAISSIDSAGTGHSDTIGYLNIAASVLCLIRLLFILEQLRNSRPKETDRVVRQEAGSVPGVDRVAMGIRTVNCLWDMVNDGFNMGFFMIPFLEAVHLAVYSTKHSDPYAPVDKLHGLNYLGIGISVLYPLVKWMNDKDDKKSKHNESVKVTDKAQKNATCLEFKIPAIIENSKVKYVIVKGLRVFFELGLKTAALYSLQSAFCLPHLRSNTVGEVNHFDNMLLYGADFAVAGVVEGISFKWKWTREWIDLGLSAVCNAIYLTTIFYSNMGNCALPKALNGTTPPNFNSSEGADDNRDALIQAGIIAPLVLVGLLAVAASMAWRKKVKEVVVEEVAESRAPLLGDESVQGAVLPSVSHVRALPMLERRNSWPQESEGPRNRSHSF